MSDMNEVIAAVLRLDAEATPGPWDEDGIYMGLRHLGKHCSDWYYRDSDGNLIEVPLGRDATIIAYYRTAAPALAREVRRLQIILEACDERSQMCLDAVEEADAELHAALDEIERLRACALPSEGAYISGRVDGERIGFRAGQEAMRERCMKVCSELILRARVCAGDDEGLRDLRCLESHMLRAIRALEVE